MVKKSLREMFPEVTGRRDKRTLYGLVSSGASFDLKDYVMAHPDQIGNTIQLWVPADDDVDMLMKGHFDRDKAESERHIKDNQIAWIDKLIAQKRIESRFNTTFFTAGDSREPELAGIRGAATGSFFTLMGHLISHNLTPAVWENFWISLPALVFGSLVGTSLDRFLDPVCLVLRYSSIFSVCRARRRWLVVWC